HIQRADAAGFEVEVGFGEVFQQVTQNGVLLLFFAQFVGVERYVLEHAFTGVFEFGAVGLFNGVQRLVDALAVAGFVTAFVQGIETGRFGQYKALVFHHLFDEFRLVAVLSFVVVVVILPYIGDVLEEQHGEDEVFVSIGADGATEGIAGVPQRFVDAVLIDLIVHYFVSWSLLSLNFFAADSSCLMLFSGAGR